YIAPVDGVRGGRTPVVRVPGKKQSERPSQNRNAGARHVKSELGHANLHYFASRPPLFALRQRPFRTPGWRTARQSSRTGMTEPPSFEGCFRKYDGEADAEPGARKVAGGAATKSLGL